MNEAIMRTSQMSPSCDRGAAVMNGRCSAAIAAACSSLIPFLFSAVACHAQTAAPSQPEVALVRTTFTLGAAVFTIFLPQAAVVEGTAIPGKVYIDFRKNTRDQQMIVLTAALRNSDARYDQKTRLRSGGQLQYRTDEDTGGGSSGAIAELSGQLEIVGLGISVMCTDQDKFYPKSEWCLPYLDRLETAQR
jgi:hypothetical protein